MTQADLDAFLDDIETFVNITKLNDDNLQNNGITASLKILTGSISTAKLADQSVTTAKLADANVTTAKIADANVTGAKLASATITEANLAPASVGTAELIDANVTGAKIASATITEANMAAASVGTPELIDGSVTTSKIADGNVTPSKFSAHYMAATSGSGSLTNGDNVFTLGNFAVSGRPVIVSVFTGTVTGTSGGGSGDVTTYLEYSANNSSWSTVVSPVSTFTFSTTGTQTAVYDNDPRIRVHSPSAGTAYYRIRIHFSITGSGQSASLSAPINVLAEEI